MQLTYLKLNLYHLKMLKSMFGSLMDPKEKKNSQNKTKKDKNYSWKSKWLISDQQSNLYL